MTTRILAVDPGDVRIGLAISDPTRTIARPLEVLKHQSRQLDAERILALGRQQGASLILVGVAYDQDGQVGPQARKSLRLVEELRRQGDMPVETWDESGSTQAAAGIKDNGPLDA
ncbi:MAG: Holliday junction resolvase RuvX, partial [Anaerolineales bacterium]